MVCFASLRFAPTHLPPICHQPPLPPPEIFLDANKAVPHCSVAVPHDHLAEPLLDLGCSSAPGDQSPADSSSSDDALKEDHRFSFAFPDSFYLAIDHGLHPEAGHHDKLRRNIIVSSSTPLVPFTRSLTCLRLAAAFRPSARRKISSLQSPGATCDCRAFCTRNRFGSIKKALGLGLGITRTCLFFS